MQSNTSMTPLNRLQQEKISVSEHRPFTFVVVNRDRENIFRSTTYSDIIKLLKKKKIHYRVSSSHPFNRKDLSAIHKAELIIVFGGDGTLLSTFKKIKDPARVKIIPVNFGTLGYITSISEDNALSIIQNYLEKKHHLYKEDHRNLLSLQIKNSRNLSLNEIVMIHKEPVRPITITVKINNRVTVQFIGDGILVSTPTGSTAYSLSVRGPILSPQIKAFILNPISPHSLNMKPIVLSEKDKLTIRTEQEVIIAIDGQKLTTKKAPVIHCGLAEEELCLIKPTHENHYKILKNKLHWGG